MRLVLLNICACLLIFSSGCDGGGSTEPEGPQSQVSGTVTNAGKAVTRDSLVVFYNKEKGLTLTGTLDSLGKYSLTAADPKVGVPAGRYEVAVRPPVPVVVAVDPSSDEYKKMMMQGGGEKSLDQSKPATAADIPEKFNDAKTSGLVFEVKAGPNTFDMDLSKL